MADYAAEIMARIRQRVENSGASLEEIGKRMGYPANTARKSAWQFLRKTANPRLSMLKKLADALEIEVQELLREDGGAE